MGIFAGLLAMGLISAVTAGIQSAVSAHNNDKNIKAQEKANEQNIQMQRETNAQNQYNIEHAHQIEMNDLKAAGLNPVLTATGGSGAPIQSLNSPKVQPVQSDVSGINSALNTIPQMMQSMMMMKMLQSNMADRNATLAAIAQGHDAQSAANAALRAKSVKGLNESKIGLYDAKKAIILGQNSTNSAKTLDVATKKSRKPRWTKKDEENWNAMIKELEDMNKKNGY